jgi:hypothetical protein
MMLRMREKEGAAIRTPERTRSEVGSGLRHTGKYTQTRSGFRYYDIILRIV